MKDIAIQTASRAGDRKLNVLREYLQNYILFLMQKTGMSPSLYFVGGTALRFLYGIRRYSEDLEFAAAEDWDPSKFSGYITKIKKELDRAGSGRGGESCGRIMNSGITAWPRMSRRRTRRASRKRTG